MIRGILVGDTLRRFVFETLPRQFQALFRQAVEPHTFGITDRSGTDATIHVVQYLTDVQPKS